MGELGEDENMALEHRLSWLALIATTADVRIARHRARHGPSV